MTTNYLRVMCVVAGVQAAAMAQVAWMQVVTAGPSARFGHAMVYDSHRGKTVLFGGMNGPDTSFMLGDTLEWNGGNWLQAVTAGPTPRVQHAMAYDSQRGKTLLFGGLGSSNYFGDTWEWDGDTWTQVAVTGPAARCAHAMTYDSQRGRTVLFGGVDPVGNYFGDTWEWSGSTWVLASTIGPAIRSHHDMVYDSQRGRTVLFGGVNYLNGNNFLGDTWEFDGTAWTQVAVTGPAARLAHAMAYDSQRGLTVLFGGQGSSGPLVGDTWDWNGTSWQQVVITGPVARNLHRMAYDSQRGKSVLFGGHGSSTYLLGDTWVYGQGVAANATPFGNGCGNPTLTLSAVVNALPAVNTTAHASLTNIPSSIAFVALGWSRTSAGPFPLPFPLAGYGMPGCNMLQSTEAAAQPLMFTGPGTATYSLPLPNWSGLIGLHLYLQGWAVAPGVNPGNTIVSNGIEWAIGN